MVAKWLNMYVSQHMRKTKEEIERHGLIYVAEGKSDKPRKHDELGP